MDKIERRIRRKEKCMLCYCIVAEKVVSPQLRGCHVIVLINFYFRRAGHIAVQYGEGALVWGGMNMEDRNTMLPIDLFIIII